MSPDNGHYVLIGLLSCGLLTINVLIRWVDGEEQLNVLVCSSFRATLNNDDSSLPKPARLIYYP